MNNNKGNTILGMEGCTFLGLCVGFFAFVMFFFIGVLIYDDVSTQLSNRKVQVTREK